jgi:hypothetical protein
LIPHLLAILYKQDDISDVDRGYNPEEASSRAVCYPVIRMESSNILANKIEDMM